LSLAQAISGLAGMGKTQTAIEYAYRYADAYQVILWVQAETRAVLVADFVTLAEELHLVKKAEHKQDEAIRAVKRWLQEQTGWLLILDNIEEFQLLREFLPSKSTGHVLLTTHFLSTGPHIERIDLGKMEPEEGALFLLRRARRLGPKDTLVYASSTDRSMALEISLLLDGLPLALDQAGAYIEETASPVSHYRNLFQRHHAVLLGLRDLSGGLNADHPLSVSATLSFSLERMKWVNPVALELLHLCTFLHPDAIPEELLLEGGVDLSPELQSCKQDPLKMDATIADLRRYALLQRNPDARTLSLHRLVQMVIRDRMDEAAQRRWATRAVQIVNRVFPQVEYWVTSSQCQRYLPQAQICATLIEAWDIRSTESARLLVQLARYYSQLALYEQAESLLRKVLALLKDHVGATYPAEAEVQQLLGWLYSLKENYAEATWCLRQAVAIHERASEPDHLIMAGCLVDLASLYFKQGKWVEAEPFCLRSLHIHEQLERPAHHALTLSLHNLGSCYCGQGKYTQAEPLLRQAFEIWKMTLGEGHPRTRQAEQDLAKCEVRQERSGYMQAVALNRCQKCKEEAEAVKGCLQNESAEEMQRHELTDEQWARVLPLLPPQKTGRKGRPAADHRRMINGIMWIDRTGAPWRDLPKRYGKWQSVSSRLSRWRKAGIWQRVLAALYQEQEAGSRI
jgi:transposase